MTNTLNIKDLSKRANQLARSNKTAVDNWHTFLVDAITFAQSNGDNFTPISLFLNKLQGADIYRMKLWLVYFAPVRFSTDEKSGQIILKKNKAADAPAYNLEAAAANPFYTFAKPERDKVEFSLDKTVENFALRIVRNMVITHADRANIAHLVTEAIDKALLNTKAKVKKAA